jgi:hypothetical protein
MTRGGGSIISHIVLRSSGGNLENLGIVGSAIPFSAKVWGCLLLALTVNDLVFWFFQGILLLAFVGEAMFLVGVELVASLFVTAIVDFLVRLVAPDAGSAGDVFLSAERGRRRIWDAPCARLVGYAMPSAAPAFLVGFAEGAMGCRCQYVSRGLKQIKKSLGSRYLHG